MTDAMIADVQALPHNQIRLSHGSNIVARQLFEFQPMEGGGFLSVNDTQQINIPISTGSPANYLNPSESMLKVKFQISGGNATSASVDNKYIFKGVSTLMKSIQVSHLTKSVVLEDLQNADLFIQASKSLIPDSFWDSLAFDIDGSIVHTADVYTKPPADARLQGEGLLCDGSVAYATADNGERRFYHPDEVNVVIVRTKGKTVECEVPLPSGLLSSSLKTLLPIFNLPLKLTINTNTIATAFKGSNSGSLPTDVKLQVRYFAGIYTMSDDNVAQNNAVIASTGLPIDFERVSNYSVIIPAGASNFAYTFGVQNISSLKSCLALLVPKEAVNNGLKDRYWFSDGSADRDDETTTRGVSSIQFSVGNSYYPSSPLQVAPYNYATLHTLTKSALLGDGGGIVYHTDSNHAENYASEYNGVYKGRLADKFLMGMSFTRLNGSAVQSGLSLINSPLSVNMNFGNSGPSQDMVLHVFLVHQATCVVGASDVAVRF